MMVPLRYGPVFSDTRNLRVPVPATAVGGDTISIQGVFVTGFHTQAEVVLTATLRSLGFGPNSILSVPRVYSHGGGGPPSQLPVEAIVIEVSASKMLPPMSSSRWTDLVPPDAYLKASALQLL